MARRLTTRRILFGISIGIYVLGLGILFVWLFVPALVKKAPRDASQLAVQEQPPTEEVDLNGDDDAVAAVPGGSDWVDSGNPDSIPLLVSYLKHENVVVRRMALAEFAGMGAKAKKAVPAIVRALQDPESTIRVQAAVTLIQMGIQVKVAVNTLARELRSEDADARRRAASAIDDLVNPPEVGGSSDWGPDPPPRIARPWVRQAVDAAIQRQ
jgi:hypothetical protein